MLMIVCQPEVLLLASVVSHTSAVNSSIQHHATVITLYTALFSCAYNLEPD